MTFIKGRPIMDITDLSIECDAKGTAVKVWAKCRTQEDVDTIIAWLHLAKGVMRKWETLRKREYAKASRSAETMASEDEAAQSRQV